MSTMGIRRACSYSATIKTPKDPSSYSEILVTFQQNKINMITKHESDLTISGDSIVVNLNQEETRQFNVGKPVLLQVRCYAAEYDAPGSAAWPLDVRPALDDTILGGGS